MDSALNNLQRLICCKTHQTNQKWILSDYLLLNSTTLKLTKYMNIRQSKNKYTTYIYIYIYSYIFFFLRWTTVLIMLSLVMNNFHVKDLGEKFYRSAKQ